MKRVVVVDDHSILLNLISDYIRGNKDYEVVGTYKSGNELLFAYKREEVVFDVVLLDLFMDDGDGFQVMEELKRLNPLIKIIVMTFNKQPGLLESVIKSGADGIISKSTDDKEIMNALNTVAQNGTFFCPITTEILTKKSDMVRDLNRINALTARERELVNLICKEELNNSQIADKLHISEKTVKTHRKNIYTKVMISVFVLYQ